MMKHLAVALVLVAGSASVSLAQTVQTVIADASKTIGASVANALTVYGAGNEFSGSADAPGSPIRDFQQSFDFTRPASVAQANQGAMTSVVTPQDRQWAQQYDLWTTPWGFLRGAASGDASVQTKTIGRDRVHVVTWSAPYPSAQGQASRVVAYIGARTNLVNAIETWVDGPGGVTLHVQRYYEEWKDGANGVKFPSVVAERRSGRRVFDMQLARVDVNPSNIQERLSAVPSTARGGGRGMPAPGGAPAPPASSARPTGLAGQ